jgi:hypothetical protein
MAIQLRQPAIGGLMIDYLDRPLGLPRFLTSYPQPARNFWGAIISVGGTAIHVAGIRPKWRRSIGLDIGFRLLPRRVEARTQANR